MSSELELDALHVLLEFDGDDEMGEVIALRREHEAAVSSGDHERADALGAEVSRRRAFYRAVRTMFVRMAHAESEGDWRAAREVRSGISVLARQEFQAREEAKAGAD